MSPGIAALHSERLLLRKWRAEDRAPFAALNADPEVMKYFPAPLDAAASDAFVDRVEALWEQQGWGLWAVEVPGVVPFAGYVGLMRPTFEASFTPCVEIGWRLARQYWGRGYAPEAAAAVLEAAFQQLGLDEILSFTAVQNEPSRRVMSKIGLQHNPSDDFDHPGLAADHWLNRHVLYRLTAAQWRQQRGQQA